MTGLLRARSTDGSLLCPVCASPAQDLFVLASHLVEKAEASDGGHVMWLNRNLTKHRKSIEEIERLLVSLVAEDRPSDEVVKR